MCCKFHTKLQCHLIVFKCTDSPTLGSKSPMPRGSAMISVKSNDQCWLSIFIGLNEFILRFRWTYEMNRSNLLAMASNLRAMASNLVVPQKAVHCTSLIHVLKSGPFTRLVLKKYPAILLSNRHAERSCAALPGRRSIWMPLPCLRRCLAVWLIHKN